jgi:hypothetical protein
VAVACLQAGPFDEQQVGALRSAVAGLPAGGWRLDGTALPSRWMVYIGRLADADAVRAKRAELRALGVDTDLPGAGFEPGVALGRYSTEEAAQRALGDLGRKGVRTARVVTERRDGVAYQLRLPQADAALRAPRCWPWARRWRASRCIHAIEGVDEGRGDTLCSGRHDIFWRPR